MQGKKIWIYSTISAVIGAVAAVVALSLVFFSNALLPKAKSYIGHEFDTLNAGIAEQQDNTLAALKKQHDDVLAAIAKLPLATTSKQIQALNAEINQTDTRLADIQKQVSLSSFKAELAPLVDALNKANTTLNALHTGQSSEPQALALAGIEKKIDSVSGAIAGMTAQSKSADLTAQLDALNNSLAAFKKTATTLTTGVASNTASLDEVRKSLNTIDQAVKAGFEAYKSSQTSLKTALDKLSQSPQSNSSTVPSPKTAKTDLVVFYVSLPGAPSAPPSPIPPLSVKYEKIGSVDAPHQTALIIQKLRPIIQKHKDCSIAVSGYADTLGGDEFNHTLSRKRALKIADALKKAFADDHVQITNTAWGERELKVWTPDATADAANRRVDIVVHCAGS